MGRLFWKFFFAFLLAWFAAGAVIGLAIWLHRHTLNEGGATIGRGPMEDNLARTAAITLRHAGMAGLSQLLDEWRRVGAPPVYVVDEAGRDILDRPVNPAALEEARKLSNRMVVAPRLKSGARRVEAPDGRPYLVFVPAPGDRLGPPKGRPHGPPPLILTLGAALLASLLFSGLLAWYLSRPVRNLRWAFDAVADGKLDTRVAPLMKRRDEIADLGRDFDRMADRLQTLVNAQRRLLHDVSHELRSPLARLQAAVGLARQSPEKLEASLARIEREAERLNELVGQVLALARLEAGAEKPGEDYFDLYDLVREVLEDARFEAEAQGKRVEATGVEAKAERLIRGRGDLLHRALDNVVRNAVRHSPPGGTVALTFAVEPEGLGIRIQVDDQGPGVPEADLEAIFEPFHRGEGERVGEGYGLGLAIARRAVQAHGGYIRALNRPQGGLRVEIGLPEPASASQFQSNT